jgi:hypothetical protein
VTTLAVLLNLLLATFGLVALVAPLAVHVMRELTPASQPRGSFALAGGWR